MTIVAANWVGENTSTVGNGPLALSGAISTFCPFSVLPDGSEVYYTLQEGFNRETGIGVVSNGTLTRKVQATLVAGVYTETDIPISLSGNGPYRDWETDRKSTRLNSSHSAKSRMPSSA